MPDAVLPSWWRPFCAIATAGTLSLLLFDHEYSMLAPALVALASACLGFEYLAQQDQHRPTD